MIKKTIAYFTLVLGLICISGCIKSESKIPAFQQTFPLQYEQWTDLRLALYRIVIEENLSFMDNSTPYPSGAHTLMIQMGRTDHLVVIITAIKGSDTVSLGINCEQQCLVWSGVRDKLIAIMKNPQLSSL